MADQLPIDDALLGKFLAGETNPAETRRVRQWLASRTENPAEPGHDDFAKFERIWAAARSNKEQNKSNRPEFDTDTAWRSVQQRMRLLESADAEKTSEINTSWPVQRTESTTSWSQIFYRIAAVLVLVSSVGWLSYRLLFMGSDHPAARMVTLVTANQKLSKTLPDGTTILLNRHSTLTYPTAFADDRRDITLTGEAFFNVTPDANRPFRIKARPTVIQVVGTSFSVRAYDDNVSVAVRTGKVRFSSKRKAVLLTPNQQATFEASADTIRRLPQVLANVFAYKTGQLVFDNEPLREVVKAINQVYNTDVRLANARLGNCRLTTRFDKTTLDTVLSVTAETFGLRIRHLGQQVILEGNGCE
ncbi:FecR family protein [Spirosoma sp. KNUC1025]|uniref:FecR family protein n=1 Tax=Spirosoma sp. KNUC1025 TaxID=2894082 RepID=UPI0038648BD5|nr:FecR domain-containing protein [Spirosoma sp. KNUC1025]